MNNDNTSKVWSSIEDDPFIQETCKHPEHNAPGSIVIPAGKILRHVCPCCGKTEIVRPSSIIC